MTTFENWCALHGKQPLPAAPADVAQFVTDCAELGMDQIWPMLQEISRAHYLSGLANPTLGGVVATAIVPIAKIEVPRSWPKEHKANFPRLPYDLQVYLSGHEAQRDKVVRQSQNDAATAKQKLAALQASPVASLLEQRKQTNGNPSNAA